MAEKFETEGRAIDAANIMAGAELFEDNREAAKFIVAEALKSTNAWGVMEDVLADLVGKARW
jgi:hypothetical protein